MNKHPKSKTSTLDTMGYTIEYFEYKAPKNLFKKTPKEPSLSNIFMSKLVDYSAQFLAKKIISYLWKSATLALIACGLCVYTVDKLQVEDISFDANVVVKIIKNNNIIHFTDESHIKYHTENNSKKITITSTNTLKKMN
ncbi:hypothetical protein C9J21_20625 [Photobacterium phosphoreum]|uniref:hypothetical protein n=1 Tax=Photobacterium phosphoreum TaxID=659 RepID=UPI000D1511FA|nr:hypothetical protein [Photobacterium phosphoreum]PSW28401.1 hypothetical protein C9J21_20625 [Photobacterium phosphoreum]